MGAVLFLVLVGGIVRSTGSGMGCPDWPKCFGLMVPPTEVSEIPASFFAAHPEYESQTFNVFQTWTEYVNRLVGALIGLFVFLTAALSFTFWKKDRRIVVLSVLAMLLTGVEAWLGKIVVDKHLEGGMVTLHMFGAMLILSMLIIAVYYAAGHSQKARAIQPEQVSSVTAWLGIGVVLLSVGQILIGTQVREHVDIIAAQMQFEGRNTWVDQLGGFYTIHKGLWVLVAGMAIVWARNLWNSISSRAIRLFVVVMVSSLVLEIGFGIVLSYMDLPPVLQPLHLLLANVMFAAQFAILINILGAERLLSSWVRMPRGVEQQSLINAK